MKPSSVPLSLAAPCQACSAFLLSLPLSLSLYFSLSSRCSARDRPFSATFHRVSFHPHFAYRLSSPLLSFARPVPPLFLVHLGSRALRVPQSRQHRCASRDAFSAGNAPGAGSGRFPSMPDGYSVTGISMKRIIVGRSLRNASASYVPRTAYFDCVSDSASRALVRFLLSVPRGSRNRSRENLRSFRTSASRGWKVP